MHVVNRALNAKMVSLKKQAGLGTVLKPGLVGAGLGALAGAGTAAIGTPINNVLFEGKGITDDLGRNMWNAGKYGALLGGAAGTGAGASVQAAKSLLGRLFKRGSVGLAALPGVQAATTKAMKNPFQAAAANTSVNPFVAKAPIKPPPLVTSNANVGGATPNPFANQPAPAGMQTPMYKQQSVNDKALIKKAKAVLIKKAMNPLLAKALTTGAAGAGVGSVGGAIGAGEGRRTQGALRGALTGGLAGAGLELGGAGLSGAVKHLAPEGHETIRILLAKAKHAVPKAAIGAGQAVIPAALGVAGYQAGKQEQVQAY